MTDSAPRCRCVRLTGAAPGAIAILLLEGDVLPVLAALTGRDDWPEGRVRLARFGDIDEGLAVRIGPRTAEIMPHGGPRVMQRLVTHLASLGATPAIAGDVDPETLYPEARDRVEALMLATLARAASPLAIDLLLDQPRRWRAADAREIDADVAIRLNRLVDPPLVVLAGAPNVGKSTLSNALLGRSMSIACDRPGTTRDYTAGLIDLAGLVVMWHDTPGLGAPLDAIDEHAMTLAGKLMTRATLLIAVTDAAHDLPDLPRPADLAIASKGERGRRDDVDLVVSAQTGDGIAELVRVVRDTLVPPADLADPGAWRFDSRI